ncbi:MAG: hypothetical protein Alis3KO_40720 [Aliiglaciecola sp.]
MNIKQHSKNTIIRRLLIPALIMTSLNTYAAADMAGVISPDGKKIAFVTDREGDYEIYVANRDGSNPTNLSFNRGQDLWPTWSPNGSQIAYSHGAGSTGQRFVYIINSDGSNKTRLTEGNDPDFSPDGKTLLFTRYGEKGNRSATLHTFDLTSKSFKTLQFEAQPDLVAAPRFSADGKHIVLVATDDTQTNQLVVLNADGTDPRIIYKTADNIAFIDWSNDNKQVVFSMRTNGNDHIFTISPTGENIKQRTFGHSNNRYPKFEPDSNSVTFTSNRHGGLGFDGDLYQLSLADNDVKRITKRNLDHQYPSVSENGDRAYVSSQHGNRELMLHRKGQEQHHRLTHTQGFESEAEISPDGRYIAYTTMVGNNKDIFVLDTGTLKTRNITHSKINEQDPRWSIDGQQLIFSGTENRQTNIYRVNVDGTNYTQISSRDLWYYRPHWVSKEYPIIFSSPIEGNWEVLAMNQTNGEFTELTQNPSADFDASLSPNGQLIAFVSDRSNGSDNIFVMKADGTEVKQLTELTGAVASPRWSTDSQMVYFEAEVNGRRHIFSVDINGQHLQDHSLE